MDVLRIKQIIKSKGITGKDLASKLGVTENSISLILNGKRQPRYETLIEIAEYLDVDIRDLFQPSKANSCDILDEVREARDRLNSVIDRLC